MERGKSKKPPGFGIARNRTAKNGRTCPMILELYLISQKIVFNMLGSNIFLPHQEMLLFAQETLPYPP